MARTLTVPQEQPDGLQQAITEIRFGIPHAPLAEEGEVFIQRDNIRVFYKVTTYSATGEVIDSESARVNFVNWPGPFTLDVKAMYAKLEAHAELIGLFEGPGTDEPLDP